MKHPLDELPVHGLSEWRTWTWYENTTAAVGLGTLCETHEKNVFLEVKLA